MTLVVKRGPLFLFLASSLKGLVKSLMKKKILLVDDHLEDAVLIKHALTTAGCEHQITFASDGESAFKLFETQVFELLLLDINMPGVDGLTLLSRLRKQVQSNVAVIVLTGSNQLSHRSRAESLGADDYVLKSTDYPAFKSSLVTALARLNFC